MNSKFYEALVAVQSSIASEISEKTELFNELMELTESAGRYPIVVQMHCKKLNGYIDGLAFAADLIEELLDQVSAGSVRMEPIGEVPSNEAKEERTLIKVEGVVTAFDSLLDEMKANARVPLEIIRRTEDKRALLVAMSIDDEQLAGVFAERGDLTPEQAIDIAKRITDR